MLTIGSSSVMLRKKLRFRVMESIRRLVCAEFGYRTDEKWGYTATGSACLYISDVHKLAENDCLLLWGTAKLSGEHPDN